MIQTPTIPQKTTVVDFKISNDAQIIKTFDVLGEINRNMPMEFNARQYHLFEIAKYMDVYLMDEERRKIESLCQSLLTEKQKALAGRGSCFHHYATELEKTLRRIFYKHSK